jgi:hypothetical protein
MSQELLDSYRMEPKVENEMWLANKHTGGWD